MKIQRRVIDCAQIGQQLGRINRQLKRDFIDVVIDPDGCKPEPHGGTSRNQQQCAQQANGTALQPIHIQRLVMRGGRIVRRPSTKVLLFSVERLTIRGRLFLLSRFSEPLSAGIDGLDVELAGQACAAVDADLGVFRHLDHLQHRFAGGIHGNGNFIP